MPADIDLHTITTDLGEAFEGFQARLTARVNDLEKRMNRPGFGLGDVSSDPMDLVEARSELARFARTGALELRTMSVGNDPSGGYWVRPVQSTSMTKTAVEWSPIRAAGARVEVITTGDAFEEPIDRGTAEVNWTNETRAPTETGTPEIGMLRVPVHPQEAEPRVTQQLLDDADRDVGAFLEGKIAEAFGVAESAAFVNGDGVAKPRGLLTYPTAATADATRPWGTIEHINTGTNGNFAASNPADVLFDVEGAMKPAYRNGACWIMSKDALRTVKKFKDGQGNYLWQPSLVAGQPSTLIGYPVWEAVDFPTMAPGSLSVAFANMRRAYLIVDRQGMTVLRDPFTAKPYVKFYTRRRVGGMVANSEAVKLIRFSS